MRLSLSGWDRKTARFIEKLYKEIPREKTETVSLKNIGELPRPVAKYLQLVLKEGQPLIRSTRVCHIGKFRSKVNGTWSSLKSKQFFSAEPPGFVWDASISMIPMVHVRVRDVYVNGDAFMEGKLLSVIPVIDESEKAELKAGALQRYLGESAWFPTALLPGKGVEWSFIDENRALATLTDSDTTVSLEFRFNNAGEITGVFTPSRYREVNGKYEPTPWAGYFCDYREKDGMRVPMKAYAEWHLRQGYFSYWKGEIVKIDYEYAQ